MAVSGTSRLAGGMPELLALVTGTMLMALSVYVDVWWHEAIGRESFWIPPHLGIYSGLIISGSGFVIVVMKNRGAKMPFGLILYASGIVGVVAAGYADELWHQRFGVEKFGTLEAIWSPTHVVALLAGTAAALGIITSLLGAIKTSGNHNTPLGWLLAAEFAVLVSIITLLIVPFSPETEFRLLGIWGAPILTFIILTIRFIGSMLSGKPWALTLITSFNWTGNAVILSNHASINLLILLVSVGLAPAVLGDLILQIGIKKQSLKKAYPIAGLAWGSIFASLFYPLTNGLLSDAFDTSSLLLIGGSSAASGLAGGLLAGQLTIRSLHTQASLEKYSSMGA